MTDLAEFLLARLGEDAAVARACEEEGDTSALSWNAAAEPGMSESMDKIHDHVQRWDALRVLAECEAKRYIVRMCSELLRAFDDREGGMWPDVNRRERTHAFAFLAHLALPYADHEAWREEWRP